MKSFGSIALLNLFCIFIFLFSYIVLYYIILSTFNLIERLININLNTTVYVVISNDCNGLTIYKNVHLINNINVIG